MKLSKLFSLPRTTGNKSKNVDKVETIINRSDIDYACCSDETVNKELDEEVYRLFSSPSICIDKNSCPSPSEISCASSDCSDQQQKSIDTNDMVVHVSQSGGYLSPPITSTNRRSRSCDNVINVVREEISLYDSYQWLNHRPLLSRVISHCARDNAPIPLFNLDVLFEKLTEAKSSGSLAKKYLTKELVSKYANFTSSSGASLPQCINHVVFTHSELLPRVPHVACYDEFKDYFDPIIADFHDVSNVSDLNHVSVELKEQSFRYLDPEFVASMQIRAVRSLEGYATCSWIDSEKRQQLEQTVRAVLTSLVGEFSGCYHPMSGVAKSLQKKFVADGLSFTNNDKVVCQLGGYRDYPSNRGLFFNPDQSLFIWVNDKDHLTVISTSKTANLVKVFNRLVTVLRTLEKRLQFSYSSRLGYLTFSPADLGPGLRIYIQLRLPLLSRLPNFSNFCRSNQLNVCETSSSSSSDGCLRVCTARCFCLSPSQVLNDAVSGCSELIRLEKALRRHARQLCSLSLMPTESLLDLSDLLERHPGSLVQQHLTKYLLHKYKSKQTKLGVTLAHCIRGNAYHPNNKTLCYISDIECYSLYSDFIDHLVQDYHGSYCQPPERLIYHENQFNNITHTVHSVSVSISRCLHGYSTLVNPRELERVVLHTLNHLPTDLHGQYFSIPELSKQVKAKLVSLGLWWLKSDNAVLRDSGAYVHWPQYCGVYLNEEKCLAVSIGMVEHVHVTCWANNFAEAYLLTVRIAKLLQKCLPLARHSRYGFLVSKLDNLGNSISINSIVSINTDVDGQLITDLQQPSDCLLSDLKPHKISSELTDISTTSVKSSKLCKLVVCGRLGSSEDEVVYRYWNVIKRILDSNKKCQEMSRVGSV